MYTGDSPTKQGKYKFSFDRIHNSRSNSQTGFRSLTSSKSDHSSFNGPNLSHRERNMSKLSRSFISRRRIGFFVALLLTCFSFVVFIFDLRFAALSNLSNVDHLNSSYVPLIPDPSIKRLFKDEMAEFIHSSSNNTKASLSHNSVSFNLNEFQNNSENSHSSFENSHSSHQNEDKAIKLAGNDMKLQRRSFELFNNSRDKEKESILKEEKESVLKEEKETVLKEEKETVLTEEIILKVSDKSNDNDFKGGNKDSNTDGNKVVDKDGEKDGEASEEGEEEEDGEEEDTEDSTDEEEDNTISYSNVSLGSIDWKTKLSHLHPSPLPTSHPCKTFAHPPPPPANSRRTGPRPCPVCYLPVKECLKIKSHLSFNPNPVLKHLTYANESHSSERKAKLKNKPPKFGGYPTLQDRANSFLIREKMEVHCGFVWGESPGVNTGYDISDEDRMEMHACDDIVVASAIFGAYDALQQPINVSPHAKKNVCFFMFVDQPSFSDLLQDGSIPNQNVKKVGLWRIILVRNIPYTDPRRTGKIPKLLMHRLFPQAKYSIWLDGKLKLVVDPYQILERFLWRGQHSFAISKHYRRFDMFVEAEANKAAGKYDNASIDRQVGVYKRDGMTPFTEEKYPIISDVPEGCLIIREHTPLSNLFGCLWFNEVDRFTSRDQICFGYTRDRVLSQVAWRTSMFLDCERRNFVMQGYHKPVMKEKGLKSSIIFSKDYIKLKEKHKDGNDNMDELSAKSEKKMKKKKKKKKQQIALSGEQIL